MKITADDPQIAARFFNVQVRDRQARILDFFLRYLTLPNERKRLKLKNPEKYGWKPRELISSLALIHAKLYQANREEWSQAVAADTDYYGTNPDIFDHLVSILTSLGTDAATISSIEFLKKDAAAAVKASTLDEENFDEIPEEFEDPLSYRLMKDPVRIPSGTILDRSTILQHLLTDNRDPFSREPMTEDDLVEDSELKDRIHAWLAEQRKKSTHPQDNMEQ
jgi:ubiquitin conjugation factor E4 B